MDVITMDKSYDRFGKMKIIIKNMYTFDCTLECGTKIMSYDQVKLAHCFSMFLNFYTAEH